MAASNGEKKQHSATHHTSDSTDLTAQISQHIPDTLDISEEQLDIWRIYLIDVAYLLSSYFMDVQYWEGVKSEKDTFEQLARTLRKISRIPVHNGTLLIRFRGFPDGKDQSEKSDYLVVCGSLVVDRAIANAVSYRQGIHMSHLAGRLTRSFSVFSEHGINNLYLKIPPAGSDDQAHLRDALHIISHYRQALKTNHPIVYKRGARQITLPLVYDERNQPDINLVLLTSLNGLTPKSAERLVQSVAEWLQHSDSGTARHGDIGVYNAIFKIKSLKSQLIRPPIEINNVRWLKIDAAQNVVFEHSNAAMEDSLVPQSIKDAFGEISAELGSDISDDVDINFEKIDPQVVGERLQRAFSLMEAVETNSEGWEILEEVIQSIQGRFVMAGDDVFESMIIEEDTLKVLAKGKEVVIEGLSPELQNKIRYYKERSAKKKQLRAMARCGMDFDTRNFNALARQYDIAVDTIEQIVDLIKSCFNAQGRFLKHIFEQRIPQFCELAEETFSFLWQYLKEISNRKDRVAYLNALQALALRTETVNSAMQVLIADLCHDPANVHFADRNAPMFACLLLRKFNKESNFAIEITPEEVLHVKEGLDPERVAAATEIVQQYSELFLEKAQTIQHKIFEAIDVDDTQTDDVMPLRFLLSLEREVLILCALLGGETSLAVLRSAVKLYGNPNSKIYHVLPGLPYSTSFMQQLKIAIRGLGRIGEKIDLEHLDSIQKHRDGFVRLSQGLQHEKLVEWLMEWVEIAKHHISPLEFLKLQSTKTKSL